MSGTRSPLVRRITSVWFLDWRKLLVYTHRWLGIAGCLLFIGWFISGVVMMYARMPGLASEERLGRAEALDLSTATLAPGEAAEQAGVRGDQLTVGMLRGRPVYRFGGWNEKGGPRARLLPQIRSKRGQTAVPVSGRVRPPARDLRANVATRKDASYDDDQPQHDHDRP